MEYPKISIDKVDQEIHRFEQTPMAEPVVQQQQQKAAITGTTSPVAPPPQITAPAQTASAPQAPPPDLSGMVSNVTSNYATMQNQMPEPKLPVDTGLKLLGGLGLLAAGGLGLHKLFGEKETAPVKPGSIESRKIGAGPQMNVNTGEPRMVGDLFPADVSTKPAGPTPENPTVDLNTKINNKPNNFNLVEESEQNKLKNETANARKQGVNPLAGATELRTGTGKPAFEGANPEGKIKSSYPDIKSVPKGYAFIPDARYIDVLRNDLGQAEYTKNLTGRPFPKEYSGPTGAVEVGKEINRSLGRETRAELLAKGIPESQLPKPTPGILEKTNAKGNKAVTVGGIVGAIAALPNLVHAAQGAGEKDVQKSYGSLVQGVGQFLGPLGAIGSELFGISPEELDTLRKAEKARKQPVPPPR
jgi:hypothetical protein